MSWNIYSTREVLEETLVQKVTDILKGAITEFGYANFLVSGGSTPVNFFKKLSLMDLDWAKVNLSLADERWQEEYRNEKMLRELLMQNHAANANLIPLVQDDSDEKTNITKMEEATATFLDRIDCLILGMGGDGHTASLFPNDEDSKTAMRVKKDQGHLFMTNGPAEPLRRISFSMDVLVNARNKFLHIYGENKKDILLSGAKDLPIAEVIDHCEGKLKIFYSA